MSLAARWQAWEQRRTGGLPSPSSVSGGPVGSPVVEIYVNEAWTDISPYVRYEQKVKITRGPQSEGSLELQASTAEMTLNNPGGLFTPRHPLSPYYGQLGRNTPLRVYVIRDGERRYRFYGEVSEWPPKSDISGNDATVSIVASGITRRLSQNAAPLRSAMFREFANPTRTHIISYWPMEDGQESTQIAASDNLTNPMTVSGTPQIAGYSGWTASDALPIGGSGKFVGKVRSYTSTNEISIRLFVYVQTAVAAETSLLRVETTGSARVWDVRIQSDGDLRILAYDEDSATLYDATLAFGMNSRGFTILDLELSQSGSNVVWRLVVLDFNNTDTIDDTISTVFFTDTVASQTVGKAKTITVGQDGGLTDVVVGHLTVADSLNAYANSAGGIVAWNGENPTSRMIRLCGEEGVPFVSISKGQTGNEVTLGDQLIKTLKDQLQEAANTDLGQLLETRDQFGLGNRSRLSMYSQDAALALLDANHELAAPLAPVDDDATTKNDVTVQRVGGSSFRTELTDGAMSTQDPPDGIGRYPDSISLSLTTDDQLADHAGWRLHLGTVDEPRYPSITVHLSHPTFTQSPEMAGAALNADIGDRITVDDLRDDLTPDQVSVLIRGYTETIDQFEHLITFACVPESPYHVLYAEADTYERVDTDGSGLTSDITSTATSVGVTATDTYGWTTVASDWPFDITVGGEVMTVTAVSGGPTTHTFTVTRSVNGIVKSHAAGTDVRLAVPTYISL